MSICLFFSLNIYFLMGGNVEICRGKCYDKCNSNLYRFPAKLK